MTRVLAFCIGVCWTGGAVCVGWQAERPGGGCPPALKACNTVHTLFGLVCLAWMYLDLFVSGLAALFV